MVRASSALALAPKPDHKCTHGIDPRLSSQSDSRPSSIPHPKVSPYPSHRWATPLWLLPLPLPLLHKGPSTTLPCIAQCRGGCPPSPGCCLRWHFVFFSFPRSLWPTVEMDKCSATGLRYTGLWGLAPCPGPTYDHVLWPGRRLQTQGLGLRSLPAWCLRLQHWRQFEDVEGPKGRSGLTGGTRSH